MEPGHGFGTAFTLCFPPFGQNWSKLLYFLSCSADVRKFTPLVDVCRVNHGAPLFHFDKNNSAQSTRCCWSNEWLQLLQLLPKKGSTSTSKLCELAWRPGIYFSFPALRKLLRVSCSYSTPERLSLWLPALTCKWWKCWFLEETRIIKLGWKKADNVLWNMECYRRQEKQLPLVLIAKISEDQTTTWEFPREQPLSQSKIELRNCLFQK